MKQVFAILLAGTAGLLLGATGMNALHAATAEPPAYAVFHVTAVGDPATFTKYQGLSRGVDAKFGGHAIVAGAPPEKLDASTPPGGAIAIIAFPSMKKLKEWWASPAYSAIRPLREHSTTGTAYVVEGLPPGAP